MKSRGAKAPLLVGLMLLLGSCVFVDRRDDRKYPFTPVETTSNKATSFRLLVSTKLDNSIGAKKTGYGNEVATVYVPDTKTAVLTEAVSKALVARGYLVSPTAGRAVVLRVNQMEVELAPMGTWSYGFFGVCDLTAFLETKAGVFERRVVANTKNSTWAVTYRGAVDTFYEAARACADQVAELVGEKTP